jgi:hypothetical protein
MRLAFLQTVLMAVFLCFTSTTIAFWRMPCRTRSGLARIDPLVSNGSVSQHAHAIHGSSGKSSPTRDQYLTHLKHFLIYGNESRA